MNFLKHQKCFKQYLKYKPRISNILFFDRLMDLVSHEHIGDTLIICLEGEIPYIVENMKPVVLKAGDKLNRGSRAYGSVKYQCLVYVYQVEKWGCSKSRCDLLFWIKFFLDKSVKLC